MDFEQLLQHARVKNNLNSQSYQKRLKSKSYIYNSKDNTDRQTVGTTLNGGVLKLNPSLSKGFLIPETKSNIRK